MKWETKYTLRIGEYSIYHGRALTQEGWERLTEKIAPREIEFTSYWQLVNFLSKYNCKDLAACSRIPLWKNTMLDHACAVTETGNPEEKYVYILGVAGENIYSEGLKEDILAWIFSEEIEAARVKAWNERFLEEETLERGVSVPYTGRWRAHWRGAKQGLSNASILRDNCANPEWTRGSRTEIANSIWQYGDSDCSRSWKDTTRYPKQWMRGVRNRLPKRGRGLFSMPHEDWDPAQQYLEETEDLERYYQDVCESFDEIA